MALLIVNLDTQIGNPQEWIDTVAQQLPGMAVRLWPDAGDPADIEYLAFMRPDFEQKLDVLKNHCKDIGRNYDDVGKSLFAQGWPGVFVTKDEDELNEHWKKRAEILNRSADEVEEYAKANAPGSWVGYPEDLIERFEYLIGLGFDFFQVMFPGLGEDYIRSTQSFSDWVIKKL